MRRQHRLETRLVHAGEPSPRIGGAVSMPIFQSANFEYAGEDDYNDLKYIRLNNTPNHRALHAKLASLEGGGAALVAASGMAAISSTLLTCLAPGDHLLAQGCLYGGTHELLTVDLAAMGIAFDFIDGNDPESWGGLLRSTTRAIYVETLSNPLLQVADHRAIVSFAREHGLTSMVDNTFASPVNFRPLELGYDLSIHSATKYLNGHSDIVGGVVIGSRELVTRVTHKINHFGGSMDPHACFLLHRGLKTLSLRVRRQNESALRLARFLESHPSTRVVHYPGLEAHPHHGIANDLFDGYGGMLAFELAGGVPAADALMERLEIPLNAPSLGGVETLVTRPTLTSHAGMSPEDRARSGIADGLVRVSVGIEAVEDLLEDFQHALGGGSAASPIPG